MINKLHFWMLRQERDRQTDRQFVSELVWKEKLMDTAEKEIGSDAY